MRKFAWAGVVSCLALGSLMADPPVWTADFEGQFPGEAPKSWRQFWGKKVDADLKQISNMAVLSGSGAMMIERSGTDSNQWGFGTELPDIANGRAVLTIPFQVQGGGGRAFNFGFEIFTHPYQGSSRIATLGFVGSKVTAMNGKWDAHKSLGLYETGKWYRVVLQLPTLGGKQTDMIARLDARDGDGKWTAGTENVVPIGAPKEKWGWLLFVPNPDSKFKVFLDDVTFAREK